MKVNELRVGNMIQMRNTGKELLSMAMSEFEGIGDSWQTVMVDLQILSFINRATEAWEFRGIDLNGHELVRLGFKHIVGEDLIWEDYKLSLYDEIWHCGNGYFIELDGDTFKYNQHTDEDTYTQLKWLSSVHGLQNLYFALEDKELEYIVEPDIIVKETVTKIKDINCKQCDGGGTIKITSIRNKDFSDGIRIDIDKCLNCGYQLTIDEIYKD